MILRCKKLTKHSTLLLLMGITYGVQIGECEYESIWENDI